MIFLPKKSLLATEQDFSALGGTVTTDGSDNIHTFTSSGTFTVAGSKTMQILIVAGGGGGGSHRGGGGGAGGLIYESAQVVGGGTFNITVGDGGSQATQGASSSFIGPSVSLTAVGGGRGGRGGGGRGQHQQH